MCYSVSMEVISQATQLTAVKESLGRVRYYPPAWKSSCLRAQGTLGICCVEGRLENAGAVLRGNRCQFCLRIENHIVVRPALECERVGTGAGSRPTTSGFSGVRASPVYLADAARLVGPAHSRQPAWSGSVGSSYPRRCGWSQRPVPGDATAPPEQHIAMITYVVAEVINLQTVRDTTRIQRGLRLLRASTTDPPVEFQCGERGSVILSDVLEFVPSGYHVTQIFPGEVT